MKWQVLLLDTSWFKKKNTKSSSRAQFIFILRELHSASPVTTIGFDSTPWDGKEKRTSERPKSIPTKINSYRNKSQKRKLLLKNLLGSKTGCPLLFVVFCFVLKQKTQYILAKSLATMPQKKALALFKVIYVSQLFILPLIL